MMNNNVEIEVIDALPIKCMTIGKVNGHHTNMRSRYLDQLEEKEQKAKERTILLTAASFLAGCVLTTAVLWAALYLFV